MALHTPDTRAFAVVRLPSALKHTESFSHVSVSSLNVADHLAREHFTLRC